MSETPPSSPIQPLSPLSPISPWPFVPSADESPLSAADTHGDTLPNATDVYASIAILGTYLSFALYLFWAIVPPKWEWTGWLPDRGWTVIVPCWLMVIVLLAYWTYAALIVYNAAPFE
ncbi:phosphatidylinositol glycan, class P [Cryptococcus gattii E566]|nr:phosphatidylinositol glycan, class P [Cryptococcus gattii E566]